MSYRILVIEDSKTQLLAIKNCLESEGYNVITACSGAEGIARAFKERPHLVISDVIMNGINGYQLCRLIRNEAELSDTPVILLTKLNANIDKFWGLKSGASCYVPKEPGFPSLIKAVRELLAIIANEPKLRLINDNTELMSQDEINNRLIQILEKLLFEATIIDEVRKIGEDILDLNIIAHKLFNLLASIYNYKAVSLIVNLQRYSSIITDACNETNHRIMQNMGIAISAQLGLPPVQENIEVTHEILDDSLTVTIDISGQRMGVLIISPENNYKFKTSDDKLFKLISEQLSIILRLYCEHIQKSSILSK